MEKGDYAVVCDPNIHDMYIAQCIEGAENHLVGNPLFHVLHMIKYPIQRSIAYTDVANENPPLMPEMPCRLQVVRMANVTDVARAKAVLYEDSVKVALSVELENASNRHEYARKHPHDKNVRVDPRELEILERHTRGEYKGTRSVCIKRR